MECTLEAQEGVDLMAPDGAAREAQRGAVVQICRPVRQGVVAAQRYQPVHRGGVATQARWPVHWSSVAVQGSRRVRTRRRLLKRSWPKRERCMPGKWQKWRRRPLQVRGLHHRNIRQHNQLLQ